LVDPERALPRAGVAYDAQLDQPAVQHEVVARVQSTPGRISLQSPTPLQDGPTKLTFLRRAD
jgi:hypothetical protein